ncbi:hypothetical protein FBEOM_4205 [Fusarium beomiforme]|uniref:DUF7908 domain-containing protein n=1 Tax=Fusarium beomiforme TaxID=44412 RepID=A0A9P5ANQ3_9HYPO|nr:hypothetical protein FBEOM_4205 [Fusarium beomiforme]
MCRCLILLLLPVLFNRIVAQDVEKGPKTYCVTYLSTYLVPISSNATGSLPTDGIIISPQTLDPVLSASTPLAESIYTSTRTRLSASTPFEFKIVESTFSTGTPETTPTVAPTDPGTNNELVIFRIVPNTDESRRHRRKRALGGFVGSTSEACQEASSFSLSEGRLLDNGRPIYYDGEDYKELRGARRSVPWGAIATTFAGDGGFLRFRNTALPNDESGFCQTPEDGQVYITFTSSPPGCVPIRLSVVGVDEYEDGETSSSSLSSTAPQTLEPPTDSMVASLPFSTVSPIAPTNPSEITSVVGFPTVISPSLDFTQLTTPIPPSLGPSKTQPMQTSSFRFYNTSSIAFPTEPIETSGELSLTNPPGVTFTQSQLPSDETSSEFLEVTISEDPAFNVLPFTSGFATESSESTTADVFSTGLLSTQSQPTSYDASSNVSKVTSTATETDITGLEPAVSSSETGTISEVRDITTEISTTTTDAETTTSPPSPARESYLVNPTVLFNGDQDWDDEVQALNLPFPVGIYTESSDTIFVGVNGLISLTDGATESSNNPFPDSSLPPVTIAAYWDNLRIVANSGYEITYNIYDDSGYRAVNLDWCVVGDDNVVTHFMVILQAYDLSNPQAAFMRYFQSNGGKSATIAVQKLGAGKFLQYSYNEDGKVPDGGSTVLFFTLGGDERVVYVPP